MTEGEEAQGPEDTRTGALMCLELKRAHSPIRTTWTHKIIQHPDDSKEGKPQQALLFVQARLGRWPP